MLRVKETVRLFTHVGWLVGWLVALPCLLQNNPSYGCILKSWLVVIGGSDGGSDGGGGGGSSCASVVALWLQRKIDTWAPNGPKQEPLPDRVGAYAQKHMHIMNERTDIYEPNSMFNKFRTNPFGLDFLKELEPVWRMN
ncbi:hypothetical protein M0802_007595 [Mischocyttarus mexicanus]|nr:hypothetical protein M0802_007595 [Mischocyttarus mexicanus]